MDFVTASNIDSGVCDFSSFAVVVDCIDDARDKAAIINKCQETGTTVVTVGGGAGLRDPTKIAIKDITKAGDDKLLFWVRKVRKGGRAGGQRIIEATHNTYLNAQLLCSTSVKNTVSLAVQRMARRTITDQKSGEFGQFPPRRGLHRLRPLFLLVPGAH
jgi:tRNA A37 threonylcarbamoyladenosine dehydratase